MIYDPSAQIVMDAQPLLDKLIAQEQIAGDRNNARREVRRQAEDQANSLRKKLLAINPDAPTVLRTYFTATGCADAEAFKTAWQETDRLTALEQQTIKLFFDSIWRSPTPDLAILPSYTFALHFTFTLAQPYLSKDDNPFYIIDNPIVRDKVFRLPMVRPSSWKGSLRHALWQQGNQQENQQIQRLFGKANDNDDSGKAGRLYCYPTFFDKTSLEIINPHNRTTRVGKNPILLESVPASARGAFTLLYVPFDRIGEDKDETRTEVAADLKLIASGVQAMLTLYGFGAKTSSGFGLAKEMLAGEGLFVLNAADGTTVQHPPQPTAPEPPEKPVALRNYQAEFPNESFTLKPDDWRKQRNATNSQRKRYTEARAAKTKYEQSLITYPQTYTRYQQELAAWESLANAPVPDQTKRVFFNFDGLVQQTQAVAGMMQQRKEGLA